MSVLKFLKIFKVSYILHKNDNVSDIISQPDATSLKPFSSQEPLLGKFRTKFKIVRL